MEGRLGSAKLSWRRSAKSTFEFMASKAESWLAPAAGTLPEYREAALECI